VIVRLLVPEFLVYLVLMRAVLLFACGYALIRQQAVSPLRVVSLFITITTFTLAILVGCINIVTESDLATWSGAVGLGAAGWMSLVFGTVGSIILLISALAVTALLLVDHDIQRSIDRIAEAAQAFRVSTKSWIAGRIDDYRERR